jgi:DNA-3-methyladenine glycosylase II
MTKRISNHLSKGDAVFAGLIKAAGPYRLAPQSHGSLFRALAHAISHQQLHANAANAILKRFVASCGKGDFPTPEEVLAAPARAMRAAGFSLAKIAALKDLAAKSLAGVVPERAGLRCRHHRAHHTGARHRPLDGGNDADVSARAPGCAAGR